MDLQDSLCPRREDGGIDHRYIASIKAAITAVGNKVCQTLIDLDAQVSKLENDALPDAVKMCLYVLLEDAARENDPKVRANRQTALRKSLVTSLQNKHFKPTRASVAVAVAAFQKELIDNKSDASKWVAALSIDNQYILCRMSDIGFNKAWAELSEWGNRSVTRQELRDLKAKYPKVEDETRGRRPNSGSRSTSSNSIQSTTPEAAPYIASEANKAEVDAMSAASPVTTESYAAPTDVPAGTTEESPAFQVMVNDVVTITATTVAESSAAIASPLPSIDDNFYEAYEKAVFALKKGTLSDAEKVILHRIADLASNFGLGRLPRR
jgi:hypothetical protein